MRVSVLRHVMLRIQRLELDIVIKTRVVLVCLKVEIDVLVCNGQTGETIFFSKLLPIIKHLIQAANDFWTVDDHQRFAVFSNVTRILKERQ